MKLLKNLNKTIIYTLKLIKFNNYLYNKIIFTKLNNSKLKIYLKNQ